MTIDIDSTTCEAYGYDKQGAAFGYTKARGFHPMVATRGAGTGEVRETIGRVRRAGATGP